MVEKTEHEIEIADSPLNLSPVTDLEMFNLMQDINEEDLEASMQEIAQITSELPKNASQKALLEAIEEIREIVSDYVWEC